MPAPSPAEPRAQRRSGSTFEPPSGAQHTLSWEDQRAVVVEVGGGLRAYRAGGQDVLDGYDEEEPCSGGRGQVLIPWPNRLRDGSYEFGGKAFQLPLSEPETRTAIHGLVRWDNWRLLRSEPDRVAMGHVLHPQPGWPGTLRLELEYRLGPDGLSVTTTAVNVGRAECPFGAGAHPYLTLGTAVDDVELLLPAARYLEADQRGLPVAWHPVQGSELDFRSPRAIGTARLDHAFGELESEDDGLARVRLRARSSERSATLWVDGAYRYLMAFTGDTLPEDRRRRGLAIEPMTCPPDALRSGEGLLRLAPGDTFTASWGITPR